MKLSKGKENIRIYCKIDSSGDIQRITMVKAHHKKAQTLSKKEIRILESIQRNDYEYEKWN